MGVALVPQVGVAEVHVVVAARAAHGVAAGVAGGAGGVAVLALEEDVARGAGVGNNEAVAVEIGDAVLDQAFVALLEAIHVAVAAAAPVLRTAHGAVLHGDARAGGQGDAVREQVGGAGVVSGLVGVDIAHPAVADIAEADGTAGV